MRTTVHECAEVAAECSADGFSAMSSMNARTSQGFFQDFVRGQTKVLGLTKGGGCLKVLLKRRA